jgi:hypothetical protein
MATTTAYSGTPTGPLATNALEFVDGSLISG